MRYALANFSDDDLSDINKIPFDHEKFENFIEEIIDTNEVDTLITVSYTHLRAHET